MTAPLDIWIPGVPRPQGSKRHVGNGRMIEASPHVKAWRQAITLVARSAMTRAGWSGSGPMAAELTFHIPRPVSHFRSGAVRLDAAPFPIARPDVDKLARACLDGLTDAGVWADDSCVVRLTAAKVWAEQDGPGCRVIVSQITY